VNKSDSKEEEEVQVPKAAGEGSGSISEQEGSENGDADKDDEDVYASRKRPSLDEEGKETIRRLRKSYQAIKAQEWIGGAFTNKEPITLVFNHLESCVPRNYSQILLTDHYCYTGRKPFITLPGQSEESLQELHNSFTPSAFGKGTETVLDESYRLARELPPDSFLMRPEALKLIESIMPIVTDIIGTPVRAELYKLNSYATGGFFGAHRDTPKSEDHIGTLVVCLPTRFTGGNLVYKHKKGKATFDWAEKLSQRQVLPLFNGLLHMQTSSTASNLSSQASGSPSPTMSSLPNRGCRTR
jgi:hypothetical protein